MNNDFWEELEPIQLYYDIYPTGRSNDKVRIRIASLCKECLLQLSRDKILHLLSDVDIGTIAPRGRIITLDDAVQYGADIYELNLFHALKEHNFKCLKTDWEKKYPRKSLRLTLGTDNTEFLQELRFVSETVSLLKTGINKVAVNGV